jgi:hypothetical protein
MRFVQGHYSENQIPAKRGFETFLGYYGGYQHPTDFLYEWPICVNQTACVSDMMSDEDPVEPDGETFNTYLFMEEASKIIQSQKQGKPFFLYYSLPLMHMPVIADQDVIDEYEEELSHLSDPWRRKTGAMAIMLDMAVEHVMDALVQAKLLPNTIIVFASDNGAQVEGNLYGAGSNFPLRGAKGSLYEGGARVPSCVFSNLLGHVLPLKEFDDDDEYDTSEDDEDDVASGLQNRRKLLERYGQRRRRLLSTYNITDVGVQLPGLFHVVDWVPTLMSAADGLHVIEGQPLDGINQWDYLIDGAALAQVDDGVDDASLSLLVAPRTEFLYNADTMSGQGAIRRNEWKLILNESEYASWFNGTYFGSDYCGLTPSQSVQLFNLTADPEERVNLADDYADIVDELTVTLKEYFRFGVQPCLLEYALLSFCVLCSNATTSEFCSFSDSRAIDRWTQLGYVSPWLQGDFDCPIPNTVAGWCTLTDPGLELETPSTGSMGIPTT